MHRAGPAAALAPGATHTCRMQPRAVLHMQGHVCFPWSPPAPASQTRSTHVMRLNTPANACRPRARSRQAARSLPPQPQRRWSHTPAVSPAVRVFARVGRGSTAGGRTLAHWGAAPACALHAALGPGPGPPQPCWAPGRPHRGAAGRVPPTGFEPEASLRARTSAPLPAPLAPGWLICPPEPVSQLLVA